MAFCLPAYQGNHVRITSSFAANWNRTAAQHLNQRDTLPISHVTSPLLVRVAQAPPMARPQIPSGPHTKATSSLFTRSTIQESPEKSQCWTNCLQIHNRKSRAALQDSEGRSETQDAIARCSKYSCLLMEQCLRDASTGFSFPGGWCTSIYF